jgi:threonine dehydrogenase-like Zn-dependent dehydrogenase
LNESNQLSGASSAGAPCGNLADWEDVMLGKQVFVTAPRRVELRDIDLPTDDLGPTEVIVRTKASLLSGGTEGAGFLGQTPSSQKPAPYPRQTGYANVGEVIAAGGTEAGLGVGDVVYSMSRHASLVRIDVATSPCLKVPVDLAPEAAVFARLIVVPFASVRTAAARAGDRTAVVGLGLVGNLGAQVMQAAGMIVTGFDLEPARRELAARCGIATADPRESDAIQPIHRLVLEASGSARGAVAALALTKLGGEVSLVGTPWVADPNVPSKDILEAVHFRYITLRSGWEWQLPLFDEATRASGVHQRGSVVESTMYAFELLRQGKVRVGELLTHRFSPEDCQVAYEGAVDRKSEQLGTIFVWE